VALTLLFFLALLVSLAASAMPEMDMPITTLTCASLYTLFCSIGLFRLKKWGWWLAMISTVPFFVMSAIGIPNMVFAGKSTAATPLVFIVVITGVILLYFMRSETRGHFK